MAQRIDDPLRVADHLSRDRRVARGDLRAGLIDRRHRGAEILRRTVERVGQQSIVRGDVVLGLPSTGLQTNGYSLARKLFFEVGGYKVDDFVEELGSTAGEALLATHSSFLPQLGPLLDSGKIKGLAHITGGGFLENIPRILPDNVSVEINRGTWPELPIFGLMQRLGNIDDHEMFRTFNMGIGIVVIVSPDGVSDVRGQIGDCYEVGRVVVGDRSVEITAV